MSLTERILRIAPVIFFAASCANAQTGDPDGGSMGSDARVDADPSCGTACDQDGDGVVDGDDQCPDTGPLSTVNGVGCADSQLTPILQPTFPPFGLTWVPTGDLGTVGGLTWTYTNIERGGLFHIYWVICDDPATPCGLSLDGPIDLAPENWVFSATDSNLATGIVAFTNTTRIRLADTTTPTLNGRLTVTIVDHTDTPVPFAALATLGVPGRLAQYGAEITGPGFKVVALTEVQEPATTTWTPSLDYYNAAPTPIPGGELYRSFGGSFYSK